MPINRRRVVAALIWAALVWAAPVWAAPVWAGHGYGAASARESRIVNGSEVERGRYPFMVSLEVNYDGRTGPEQHFCGGTLVDREWVLTAAHCLEGADPARVVAVVGRTRLSDQGSGSVRDVRLVVVHPGYDGDVTHGADVALVRLAAPVEGVTPLEPVRPDERALWEPGDPATVTGWGVTGPDSRGAPDDLLAAEVAVQPDAVMSASDLYGGDFKAADMIGAGPREGGFGPCYGDSGGPLLIGEGRDARQIGIVSWGEECASSPAVYTRLGEGRVRSFIDSKIPLRVADARTAEGGAARFTVSLGRPSTIPVDLRYATASVTADSETDFTATAGTLHLPAGVTSAVITVPTTQDTRVERDETFRLIVTSLEGAAMAADGVTGTILDDE